MLTGRWLGVLCMLITLTCAVALRAADGTNEPANGTVTGILTAKGADWVEVQADGAKTSVRYLPYWRGGMPQDGGGYDKAMLDTLKHVYVLNRVKLAWEFQEHKRIVSIEMLIPATKDGIVTAKGENWIEVKPDNAPAERYMPQWVGGLPKDGGGLNKEILTAFAALKIGDRVEVQWLYNERKRALDVHKVEAPATPPTAQ